MRKIRNLLLMFICFAVCGWLYEVLYTLGAWGVYENRGVLFGPWLPLYGFGGSFLYAVFRPWLRRPVPLWRRILQVPVLFVGVCLMTTLIELGASYLLEAVGFDFRYLWDYIERPMNFEGRIALSASLWFGALGLVMIYGIVPLYRRLVSMKNQILLNATAWPMIVLFLIDATARIWLGSNYMA